MFEDVSILPANASETERRGLRAAIAIIFVIAVTAALSMVLVPQSAARPRLFGTTLSPTGAAPTTGPKAVTKTAAAQLAQPVVGGAATPSGKGYWLVATDGGIFTNGDARFLGSTGGIALNRPIVGMAATPSGNGYWLVASDGGIFTFGDAAFHGSTGGIALNQPIVGMSSTRSGNGYWLVASDGGIFSFGDAAFHGSTGGTHLNRPIVGMTTTRSGHGYWFVATDGGIFSFGDASFAGSTGGAAIPAPIIGMATSGSGHGYWLGGADGSVYTFGDAAQLGTAAGMLGENAAALVASPSGQALWVAGQGGTSVSLPSGATYSIAGGGGGGTSNSYSYLSTNPDGSAVRWNPCQPIHFVTNLSQAPATASQDILGAMSRIQAATGISFVWDGPTTEVPENGRQALQPRYGNGWAPLLIAWSTPGLSNVLPGGGVLGEGGATWMSQGPGTNGVYVTGVVDVDAVASAPLAPGFGGGLTMGDLLLHELGHVVGLGHTSDTNQVMFPDILPRPHAGYGPGDLTGLAHLGTSQGCNAPPAP